MASNRFIRVRKIALHDEQVAFRCAEAPLHRQLTLSHGQRLLVVARTHQTVPKQVHRITPIALTYKELGRHEDALILNRDVYSGWLKLYGKQHTETLREANNLAVLLKKMERFEEAKALMRETIPVARRVLGENHEATLMMRWNYANAIFADDGATLGDQREAVTKVEELAPTARRVLGGEHPIVSVIERSLKQARAVLRARKTQPSGDF